MRICACRWEYDHEKPSRGGPGVPSAASFAAASASSLVSDARVANSEVERYSPYAKVLVKSETAPKYNAVLAYRKSLNVTPAFSTVNF